MSLFMMLGFRRISHKFEVNSDSGEYSVVSIIQPVFNKQLRLWAEEDNEQLLHSLDKQCKDVKGDRKEADNSGGFALRSIKLVHCFCFYLTLSDVLLRCK